MTEIDWKHICDLSEEENGRLREALEASAALNRQLETSNVRLNSECEKAWTEITAINKANARMRLALEEIVDLKGRQRTSLSGTIGYNGGYRQGSFTVYEEVADIARAALGDSDEPR